MCWTWQERLPCTASGATSGRRDLLGQLDDARDTHCADDGRLDEELLYETGVVTAELLSNATRSCRTTVSVRVDVHRHHLRVTVYDDGEGAPLPRSPRPEESQGRGLGIVEGLSRDWGTDVRPAGKVVWAEMTIVSDSFDHLPCSDAS